MKNLCVLLATCLALSSVNAQTGTDPIVTQQMLVENKVQPESQVVLPTDEEILKMNIFDACRAVGVDPSYNARYDAIIIPLCEQGVMIFPASAEVLRMKADAEAAGMTSKYPMECLEYGGNAKQNATLIRNLVANKHLIKNGKLIPGAAKKWKVVK